ncbi:MAG: tRNA lysidine(34) synthetase TilS [Lentisphaerae bacterium]|nr:tRNA lysidine(34) synthetase TilS [Lentisphaerota bacterium]
MQMDYSIFSRFRNFKVFAGCSGGADSTALLLLAAAGAREYGFELTAIHFNHHLRGAESDKEAENAASLAENLGVKFQLIDLDIPPGSNLEARARAARLAHFRKLAANDPQAVVLLGHHADDRVENLFLRLFRGSNVSALTAIRMDSSLDGVRIFRPLINCTRREIEEFLRANGIGKWAQDSSNFSDIYGRNFLRNRILPEISGKFPHAPEALRISLANLECDADFIESAAEQKFASGDPEKISFWQNMHPALLVRCLRRFLDETFGEDLPVSRDSVNRFKTMVDRGCRGKVELDGRRSLMLDDKELHPCLPPPEKILWQWRSQRSIMWGKWRFTAEVREKMPAEVSLYTACFALENFPETIVVSAAEAGDKMLPFGRKSEVKVKELRIKRGIAAYPPYPVVRDQCGVILWLPGIRHSGRYTCLPGGGILVISAEKS